MRNTVATGAVHVCNKKGKDSAKGARSRGFYRHAACRSNIYMLGRLLAFLKRAPARGGLNPVVLLWPCLGFASRALVLALELDFFIGGFFPFFFRRGRQRNGAVRLGWHWNDLGRD
jgi:hypothetical protein